MSHIICVEIKRIEELNLLPRPKLKKLIIKGPNIFYMTNMFGPFRYLFKVLNIAIDLE